MSTASAVRAHVVSNLPSAGVDIVLVVDTPSGRVVWGPGSGKRSIVRAGVTPEAEDVEPLRLTDEDARALLAGLLRFYEGGEDLRALRRDYDAERARVDKLIDAALRGLDRAMAIRDDVPRSGTP